MTKSLVTFIRQSLKVKGKSEHTGRGCFWMGSTEDIPYNEVEKKITELLPKWIEKGIVLDSCFALTSEGHKCCRVLFDDKVFGSYNMLYKNEQSSPAHLATIGMTFNQSKL